MDTTTRDAVPAAPNAMKATRVPWQLKFTALTFIWALAFC